VRLTAGGLVALSLGLAVGGIGAYVLLFRVAAVRNHPEGYVVALALATAVAAVALARTRRWYTWLGLGVTAILLVGSVFFNFVAARVPTTPTALKVGEPAPDFTLSDAAGRSVTLSDFRGKKPVVLVFYRGAW
jgi:hypothetical protein